MLNRLLNLKCLELTALSLVLMLGACGDNDGQKTDWERFYTEKLVTVDGRWAIQDMRGYYNNFVHIDESEEWSGVPYDSDKYGDFIFSDGRLFQTVEPNGSKIIMEGLWSVEDKSLVLEYVDKEEVKKVVDRFDIVSLGGENLVLKQQYKNDTCEFVNTMTFKFSSDLGYTDDNLINYGSRWILDDATGYYRDLVNAENDKTWSGAPQPGYEFGNFIFMSGNSFSEIEVGGYERIAEGEWNLNRKEITLEYEYRNNSDRKVEVFKIDTLTELRMVLRQETSDDKHEYKNLLTYRKSALRSPKL